jgi:hypothetical protein
MKGIPIILATLAASTIAGCQTSCSSSTAGAGTSVSSSSTPDRSEATLVGTQGRARVGNDIVELKNGSVFVNGESYGSVTATQKVQYIVTAEKRMLLVDGEVRAPVR